jgi:hypothetical protein
MLNKKTEDLTLEEKQDLVTAMYMYWIFFDAMYNDYSFLNELIKGQGLTQLDLENHTKEVLLEFDEIFAIPYTEKTCIDLHNADVTVEEMLSETGHSDIIQYLSYEHTAS